MELDKEMKHTGSSSVRVSDFSESAQKRRSDYRKKNEMKQLLLQNQWDFLLVMKDGSGFGEQLCSLEPSCRLVMSARSGDRASKQYITHW